MKWPKKQKAENKWLMPTDRALAVQPSKIKLHSTSQGESRDSEKAILFRNCSNQYKKIS